MPCVCISICICLPSLPMPSATLSRLLALVRGRWTKMKDPTTRSVSDLAGAREPPETVTETPIPSDLGTSTSTSTSPSPSAPSAPSVTSKRAKRLTRTLVALPELLIPPAPDTPPRKSGEAGPWRRL